MKNIVLLFYMFVIYSMAEAQVSYVTTNYLMKNSQFIVEGKVIKVTPRWDEEKKFIHSFIDVNIKRVLKGNIKSSIITLKEVGGSIDNITTSSEIHPVFHPGESVVLFLNSDMTHQYYTNGFWLGKFLIDDKSGKKKLVRKMREIVFFGKNDSVESEIDYDKFKKSLKTIQ